MPWKLTMNLWNEIQERMVLEFSAEALKFSFAKYLQNETLMNMGSTFCKNV